MDVMAPMASNQPLAQLIMIRVMAVGAAVVVEAAEMAMTPIAEAVEGCHFIHSFLKSRPCAFRIGRWAIIRRLARPCILR